MKQILIISGKGGTGKTILTGAFAAFVDNKIMADCDVDASDLHLLLLPEIKKRDTFKGGRKGSVKRLFCSRISKDTWL